MKILLCPDSYKGSLSAIQVTEAMETGIRRVFQDAEIVRLPIADGGEGTVEALVMATEGEFRETEVCDPIGEPRLARWGILGEGRTAVMEMAAASGLTWVPQEKRDPRQATTFGTGEMIRAALDEGLRHFIIGIGGSATNDGGVGMLRALGGRFLDREGQELPEGGGSLIDLDRIDLNGLDPRLAECRILIACDVDNPLCGPRGASAVYGPQKGATPEVVIELDAALSRYAQIARATTGRDIADLPGAGAAGGLGAGFLYFTQAELKPGVEIVLDAISFDHQVRESDWVLTGEGRTDFQTAFGKAPVGVAKRAAQVGVPTLCLSGSIGEGYQDVLVQGIHGVMSVVPCPTMSLEDCMEDASELVIRGSEQLARILQAGIEMGKRN